MKNTINFNLQNAIFALPILLILFSIFLINSTYFQQFPQELSIGITLDFVVTVPFIYFLIIRKRDIPNYTVASVFVLCLIIASFAIPAGHQNLLANIKLVVLPIVEFGVIGFISFKLYQTSKEYKLQKKQNFDFFSALQQATRESFPARVSTVLATEIAVIYYGLFPLKKREIAENEFTYHKKSGIILVLYVFIFLVFAETAVVHIMVAKWNITVAWVLTFLSLYTCFQIFALTRSMSKRPIILDLENNKLQMRYGFFSETTIELANITGIELTSRSLPEDKNIAQFSPLGLLDSHNIILHLKSENVLSGFYGIKKKYESLAIYVDDKKGFEEKINTILETRS